MTSNEAARNVRARFPARVVSRDVERYAHDSRAREVAERARARFTAEGIPRAQLVRCAAEGRDGTHLPGRLKVYLPLEAAERPFRMVFTPIARESALVLLYLAFGVAHQPSGSRAPSVYEIAHRRVHGGWPRRPPA